MTTILDIRHETIVQPDLEAEVYIDAVNKRIKLLSFGVKDYIRLTEFLLQAAEKSDCSKIWLVCSSSEWLNFLSHGFVLEGVAENYLNGHTGFFMSYFLTGDRRFSPNYKKDQMTLSEILKLTPEKTLKSILPKDYCLRKAETKDISLLSILFAQVFETYPVPVTEPEYLSGAINTKSVFYIIEHKGKFISAASADMDFKLGNAEITDCATLPDYRGNGLMYILINALESEVISRGINCLYTLARAKVPGIGKVFHKLGYQYRGRLINNCNICGNFEDMNLWIKYIGP